MTRPLKETDIICSFIYTCWNYRDTILFVLYARIVYNLDSLLG